MEETPGALHTWYVSCDLQLFPIGLVLVYMFTRSHSGGLKFALTTLAVATILPFFVVYLNNYDAVLRPDRSYPGPNNFHVLNVYTQTYVRGGPYIISIISAFLLLKIRENKWTLSLPFRYLVLFAAIGVSVGSQFYAKVFYGKPKEHYPLEHALFVALHRSLWSLMICALIVIQLAWGFGRSVDRLLTHHIFVPLSRLTYIVYLFHFIWLVVSVASTRTPVFLSTWQTSWILTGDIFVSFGTALWLYLIIEGPSSHLISAFMRKITRKWQSEGPQVQESKKEE